MSKKYIPNSLLVDLEQFKTNDLPLPFIETNAASTTGYYIIYDQKTYMDEKPADIPETIQIKIPIANNDYYLKTGKIYKVYPKSKIDNFFTEI